jgi:hypothetical protein
MGDVMNVLRHWLCPDCGWIATTDDGIVAACCANHGRKCGPQMEQFDPTTATQGAVAILRDLAGMSLRANGKDFDRLVKAARDYLPEYADLGGQS